MREKKTLNNLISLLPTPAAVIDSKGIIEEANLIFKEKFNFNKISKKNKLKIQSFLNFDISNVIKKLSINDMSISSYDYKFIDLDQNEITVDLHFKNIYKNKILMILDQKDNFKSYLTHSSKVFSDKFMEGFLKSLSLNISSPITNILGALELMRLKEKKDITDDLFKIISHEGTKVKSFISKVNSFNSNTSLNNKLANIHECLDKAINMIDESMIRKVNLYKDFDPSIPEIAYDEWLLTKCFYNVLINSFECKSCTEIKIVTRINHDVIIRSNDFQKILKLPIHVKIMDNGNSVNEDIEKFMFYPFISNKTGSDGLGLTLVNQALSNLGGHVNYEREKDLSSFNLYFPLNK